MRVKITLRGEANAQALFDVLVGHAVRWSSGCGWQVLTFQSDSVEAARSHVADLFPNLRFSVKEAVCAS